MPYIDQQSRKAILDDERLPTTAGELNYLLATQLDLYLSQQQRVGYAQYNEVIGVLECLKLEIYRRLVAPYEDIKKDENGDVFEVGDGKLD